MAQKINKCIELLKQNVPLFSVPSPDLTYESGREMAQTWADIIQIDFEHNPFDTVGLCKFMRGLHDGGPTPSGHPTPTVITTLPSNCMTPDEVIYNAWQARHVLSAGVHGVLHTHARTETAVRAFVSSTRYPFQTIGLNLGLPEGIRGGGGQKTPAEIWGIDATEYTHRADPWPLNPDGELLLGLKIEDRHCLPEADAIAAVPGISFAEWGPGDMGMSFGDPALHDPPYTPVMDNARNIVKTACDRAGLAFMCGWADPAMTKEDRMRHSIQEIGAKITHGLSREAANTIRQEAGRTMPV